LEPKAEKCRFVGYPEGQKGWRLFNPTNWKIITSCDVVFEELKVEEVIQPATVAKELTSESESELQNPFLTSTLSPYTQKIQELADYGKGPVTALLVNIANDHEPLSYQEAINNSDANYWKDAIAEEMDSLIKNGTFEVVSRPADKNIVSSKWIFKKKLKVDGTIDRFKARLVARGFSQVEGIDYEETFAPTIKFTTLRLLLAYANYHDKDIHQMDIKTAFLYGELHEEIFMEPPDGYKEDGMVWKLKKSLYGLKQAPRMCLISKKSLLQ